MAWDLSCPDWWERLQSGRLPIADLPLWTPQAERAAAIFGRLRLADVPGTPTVSDAGGEWFQQVVRCMFGSVDPQSGQREIRDLFALVPKKNAKTTFGALGMVTATLLNRRPRATFLMTAPVQDTAQMAFDAAAGAIELDAVLAAKFHIRHHLKTIIHRETKSSLEIMTFDPGVLTGVKVSGGALIDELHECAKKSKAAQALRQIRGGMVPYPEAFLWFITTQSDEQPVGVFADELKKARAIRDGKRIGKLLPVLFEFPRDVQQSKDQQWKDPRLWPLLNPNIGRAMTLDRMVEEFNDAAGTSEAELRSWASQHLNVQIGVALHQGTWAGAEFWEQQGRREVTLDYLLEWSEVATFGIDGGGLEDLLGASAVGRHKITGEWLHWAHAWAHTSVFERRKEIAPQLLDYAADGDLTIVEQVGDDTAALAEVAARFEEAGLLDKIGVDQAGLGSVLDALAAVGIPAEKVVGISQGWKMMGAIKTLERHLAKGDFLHGGTRLMAWCVGNAKTEPAGNAVYITKRVSGTAKIDPLIATLNAVTLMALNPAPPDKFDIAAALVPMRLRYGA
ncbi:terminase large subunit [Lysobacter enzymogenes]|uniref:terminase large subunit n=1 Tax=Lysobacter enzymogenes TaxID=69 RepID=UPI00089A64E3|nr:terminase large subunit [Lysobacter enzymogenes]SDW94676.1 Phage terminase-like protein, large subunit, contains N-terminal HTH domain [Lysobacter enzymogenes]